MPSTLVPSRVEGLGIRYSMPVLSKVEGLDIHRPVFCTVSPLFSLFAFLVNLVVFGADGVYDSAWQS